MDIAIAVPRTDAPVDVPVKRRDPVDVICPSCGHGQNTRATTVTCAGCNLRAPISAFKGSTQTRKFGAPRAWTISGNVD